MNPKQPKSRKKPAPLVRRAYEHQNPKVGIYGKERTLKWTIPVLVIREADVGKMVELGAKALNDKWGDGFSQAFADGDRRTCRTVLAAIGIIKEGGK